MGTNLLVPCTNCMFAALLDSHRAQDGFASHLHSQRVMSYYFYLLASCWRLYLYKREVHLCPSVTRFTPSQWGVMGSVCVHSSPFSGSGNPVGAFWVCTQQSICPENYNARGLRMNRYFLCNTVSQIAYFC